MSLSHSLVLLGQTVTHIAVSTRDCWNWSEVVLDDLESPEISAAQIFEALQSAGCVGGSIVLGVPASRCLTGLFDSSDLPANDYKAKLFRFEEHLPLSAEQVAAEFTDIIGKTGDRQTFGIALEREWIERLVSALETHGLAVDFIVPSTLLAVSTIKMAQRSAALIADPTDSQWQLLMSDSEQVTRWLRVPPDVETLRRLLLMPQLCGADINSIHCVETSLTLDFSADTKIVAESDRFQSLITVGAEALLQGRSSVPDFRRNGLPAADRFRLNRRAINASLVAVAAMMVLVSLSLWFRAARYNAVSDRNQQLMMTHFHATLPGWPTPSNFRAIVASERRRLTPAGDGAGGGFTALSMMARVLHSLPESDDVALNDLSFAPQRFDLAGTLKRYESSQPLSDALRANNLNVSPVQAHRVADTSWQFMLSGQMTLPPKAGQP